MNPVSKPTVLIVDEKAEILHLCDRYLGDEFRFEQARDPFAARDHLRRDSDTAGVILDLSFAKTPSSRLFGSADDARNEGLHTLRWLRDEFPSLPVLMIAGNREQNAALVAVRLGAEYLYWGDLVADPKILRARLRRTLSPSSEETNRVLAHFHAHGVVGSSPRFARTLIDLSRALVGSNPILLLGETGTGKDLLAVAAHALGGDAKRPFVPISTAALSETLIESELFGHSRGAYTGAERARIGKMRLAHGGSLFLNEIGDLSLTSQAKLLTALEEKQIVPVGDENPYPADFRLIAATSRDLRGMVRVEKFRKDLFYRLAWNTIEIPPLRERRQDIPKLIQHFLRSSERWGSGISGVTHEAGEYLRTLSWDGNIRQLRAVIEVPSISAEHFITLMDVRDILSRQGAGDSGDEAINAAADVDAQTKPGGGFAPRRAEARQPDFGELSYRQLTEHYFRHLEKLTGGNLLQMAKIAGISKATAYNWKRKYLQ